MKKRGKQRGLHHAGRCAYHRKRHIRTTKPFHGSVPAPIVIFPMNRKSKWKETSLKHGKSLKYASNSFHNISCVSLSRLDAPITRAEAVVILNRVLNRQPDRAYIDAHTTELRIFTDVRANHWAWYDILERPMVTTLFWGSRKPGENNFAQAARLAGRYIPLRFPLHDRQHSAIRSWPCCGTWLNFCRKTDKLCASVEGKPTGSYPVDTTDGTVWLSVTRNGNDCGAWKNVSSRNAKRESSGKRDKNWA